MRWLLALVVSLVGGQALLAADARVERNVPYAKPGDSQRSLDVYAPAQGADHPVVVWIHGGGWHKGDKAAVQEKPRAFVERGYVFVSIGYRLMPQAKGPAEQADDVAAAIAWVHKHTREYGGSPERIFVMGHSARAHLAALVCTDDTYLKRHGLSLANTAGCVPVDTAVYDVPAQVASVAPLRTSRMRKHLLPTRRLNSDCRLRRTSRPTRRFPRF